MVFVDLIGERKQRKNQRRLVQFHRLVQLVVHRCEPLRLRRTELSWALADRLREGGQEYGASTGRARRCGWFDAVVVRYSARINGLDGLALTKLDVLDGLPEVLLCTGYRTSSGTLSEFPADLGALASAEPIYETLPGWSTPTKGATRMEQLPPEARRYIERLEELSGVPCAIISTGSDRGETIVRPDSVVAQWLDR
jgi:adenylosuccinate synthase